MKRMEPESTPGPLDLDLCLRMFFCSLLVLNGIYHYWTYGIFSFSPGVEKPNLWCGARWFGGVVSHLYNLLESSKKPNGSGQKSNHLTATYRFVLLPTSTFCMADLLLELYHWKSCPAFFVAGVGKANGSCPEVLCAAQLLLFHHPNGAHAAAGRSHRLAHRPDAGEMARG